ncbi:MAG TPA: membrane dipeptidase [Allosphingosinicella sp.]|jgi:membrane dipeptidase
MEADRRTILAGGAVAVLTAAAPVRQRRHEMLIVNALGGLENPNHWEEDTSGAGVGGITRGPLEPRILADAHASGMDVVNVTLGYVAGPMEKFEYTIADIGAWDARARLQSRDLMKVLTAADILQAKREKRIGLIYGFQNGAMMGDKAERVDIFADLGIRVVQLTYNPANRLGDGAMAPENRGLTPFGREVVERLNAKRLMVDLSHSGERTCLDAARASTQPISINHTGCRALVDLPRNKSDAELRLVASRGGFVGIYFMPFLNVTSVAHEEDVVAHIDHAVNVCGEDHVGIGTDGGTTGIDDMAAYRAHVARQVADRKKAGIGAAGENPDTLPFVADLQGPGQFRRLADLLRRKGYPERRIEKIMGLNFLAYAREVWGA